MLGRWVRAIADDRRFVAVSVAELGDSARPRSVIEGERAPGRRRLEAVIEIFPRASGWHERDGLRSDSSRSDREKRETDKGEPQDSDRMVESVHSILPEAIGRGGNAP